MENIKPIALTLFQLNSLIKNSLQLEMPSTYWVIAEISELNEHSSGHCYMELCQKDEHSDVLRAKARATIWSNTYRMLRPYFESVTGRNLERGLKILINVQVVFHEVYGFSLKVLDMEPRFTLGEIEQTRRETIQRLTNDGVVDMNRDLILGDLPKRVAIISSPKAAGLQDFVNQLDNNKFGYVFTHTIFAAVMQGDAAEESIIVALNQIAEQLEHFDLVVIVRGGGSQADLACFDSYELALHVAQFPLPVVAGIGHDKDKSVVDLVAHTSVKTPTAAAEFLINVFTEAETELQSVAQQLSQAVASICDQQNRLLDMHKNQVGSKVMSVLHQQQLLLVARAQVVPILVNRQVVEQNKQIFNFERQFLLRAKAVLTRNKAELAAKSSLLAHTTLAAITRQKLKLQQWQKLSEHINPCNIMKKGYSLTYFNGKLIKSVGEVNKDAKIVTKFHDGELESEVKQINLIEQRL